MATKLKLDQLKSQIDRLRKDSLEIVANANRIVYGGVQKLADKELKALNDYYKAAVASIKASRRNGVKDAAQKQIDLLQDTVNQVIGHARESVGIVAEARAELSKLVQSSAAGAAVTEARLEKAVTPARKALSRAKTKARAAGQKADKVAKATRNDARKDLKKVGRALKADVVAAEKTAGRTAAAVERKAGSLTRSMISDARAGVAAARKAAARAMPSPDSRASRATSKAKKAVVGAVDSASNAVNAAVGAIKSQS